MEKAMRDKEIGDKKEKEKKDLKDMKS